jgi:hypothetical protein
MDYKYIFVVDGNERRSIDVGILSRYPIEKIDTRIHVLLLLELAPIAASKLWFRSYASML